MMMLRALPPTAAEPELEPPHNLEAEQGLLGGLLLWNRAIEDASFVDATHFYDPLHTRIFQLITDKIRAGHLADPVTLRPHLEGLEPVNDGLSAPQYLGLLAVRACPSMQVKHYARTVVDLSLRRSLIMAGEDLVASARDVGAEVNPVTLIEDAEAHLFALAEGNKTSDTTTHTFAEATIEAVELSYEAYKGGWVGLKTSISDLDSKLGGLQDTDLVILAGRPSMGKTALATNIAFHVAKTQKPVLFFSLEMGARQLAARVLGEKSEIAAGKFRSGRVTEDQLKRLVAASKDAQNVPLYIDDMGGISISQLVARARRMKRKHAIGLIVVDYLQLMQASRRNYSSRVQDITEITTSLKALAKELRVPILALSQLSRETERRENKRPQLADLRESGSIEQDADVVMFCYREDYYVERDQPPTSDQVAHQAWQLRLAACTGKAEIIIGKHRHGEVGSVPVAFNAELTRFSGLAGEAR